MKKNLYIQLANLYLRASGCVSVQVKLNPKDLTGLIWASINHNARADIGHDQSTCRGDLSGLPGFS